MPRYRVNACYEVIDQYIVEAESEEAAIERCQDRGRLEPMPPDITYHRDVSVECTAWVANPIEEAEA